MNKCLILSFVLLIYMIGSGLMSCNPKTTTINKTSDKTVQTDECLLMEEICAEALDFQNEYDRMPEEERKDMASVLSTYVTHCEEAKKNCEKSKKSE